MGKISSCQLRKIYAIAQSLGMVTRNGDDALHDLTESMTGKEHLKELTYEEALKLIGELETKQGDIPPPRKRARPVKSRSGGASDGQQRKVWALMYQLQQVSPSTALPGDRLCGIIRRELQMDAFATNPFAWIDYPTCIRLIEAIKGYIKSAKTKKGVCGE